MNFGVFWMEILPTVAEEESQKFKTKVKVEFEDNLRIKLVKEGGSDIFVDGSYSINLLNFFVNLVKRLPS